MREENVDERKRMLLLLYSKTLWVYKHLMIAYYGKVFFLKLMQYLILKYYGYRFSLPGLGVRCVCWPGSPGCVCAHWSGPSLSASLSEAMRYDGAARRVVLQSGGGWAQGV